MIHGKPAITSNIGVMSSIIDNNENGLLTEPGNSSELKKSIESLYFNEKKCIEMGQAAMNKAKRKYSEAEINNSLIQCYEKAIKNKFKIQTI